MPALLQRAGEFYGRFFTPQGRVFVPRTGRHPGHAPSSGFAYVTPKPTTLAERLGGNADPGFVSLLERLLHLDHRQRPSGQEALEHPWLQPLEAESAGGVWPELRDHPKVSGSLARPPLSPHTAA